MGRSRTHRQASNLRFRPYSDAAKCHQKPLRREIHFFLIN